MLSELDLVNEAKKLPYSTKRKYLLSMRETEIHKVLASLINHLEEDYACEITHSKDEHGRDLVIKYRDRFGEQFIGVIVKKGDSKGVITGKTNRKIDEVISQANQAISHPCPLRELRPGVVRINQIWIFFIGTLTSTASERIAIELKDFSKRLFGLAETISLISDNYPEIFFNAELAEFVKTNLGKFESLSITPDQRKVSTYLSPWVSKWETPKEITDSLRSVILTQKIPFSKLTEVISSHERIILTGEPGVGKTTAIVKIASDMLKNSFITRSKSQIQQTLDVPIVIKAKTMMEKTTDEIYREFKSLPSLSDEISISTLMVDGLDEINIDERNECIDRAKQFADKYQCGLVITCRKIPMILDINSPFDRYELLPLEITQAIAYVEQSVKDQRLIQIINEGILSNELKIHLTPLALELLIEVVTFEREIPASLAEIFERYADVSCGKYDRAKGIESVFEYHVKERFLGELAWKEFYLNDLLEIPEAKFRNFVESYAKDYGFDEPTLRNFISEIERSGLIRIDDIVRFWHRSFLDYFIASRISEKRTEYPSLNKDIVSVYFDDLWTDVAFFFIGIQRELNPEIITGIEDYQSNDFEITIQKVLIGRLLQAGWHTPSKDKIKAISVGLDNVQSIRKAVDKTLSLEKRHLPTIFSDFFYLILSEYSFGSRTMLTETSLVCDKLVDECTLASTRNCLLLVWAQRSRLSTEIKTERSKQLLIALSKLEIEGELTVRDKFVNLLILEHIERYDPRVLRSIRRKMKRVRELYPEDMRKLLPPSKGSVTFSFRRGRRRNR